MKKQKGEKKSRDVSDVGPDPSEPQIRMVAMTLITLISYEWIWWICAFGFSACSGAMPILFYLFMGNLLDGLGPNFDIIANVNKQALNMTMVAIGAGVAAFFQQFFLSIAYERIGNRLRAFYFESLLQQEIGYFDRNKSGKLLAQISEDIIVIQESLVTKMSGAGQFVVSGCMGLILAFVSSWQMTLIMLATSPILACAIVISAAMSRVFASQTSKATAEAMNTATEVIGGIRTVRSMAGEVKEQKRFDKNLSVLGVLSIFKSLVTGFTGGFTVFSIWGSVALAFWYGGGLVKDNVISIGDMMKVFGMMLIGSISFSQVLTLLPEVGKVLSGAGVILKVIKRKPQVRYAGGLIPESYTGVIDFDNVDFAYPTRPHIPVLKKFSLKVNPGQQIALVGSSGSGKSTIVGLLERFYDPTGGMILLDGKDLKTYDPAWLHTQIAIVTQEPVLFAMTLRENIMYGVPPGSVSQEDIENAAKTANAHNFIVDFAKKYDTKIGERGVSLSGGQKQRVAIARAVLQNPKILLLDEATSALDTQSEHIVQDALDKLMVGRTTIIIAHRLSTVQNCDKILVIQYGVCVESGTHHELLAMEGFYHKLATKQIIGNDGVSTGSRGQTPQVKSDVQQEGFETVSNVQPTVVDTETQRITVVDTEHQPTEKSEDQPVQDVAPTGDETH